MEDRTGVNTISHAFDNFIEYIRLQIGFALGSKCG
jgi:hypothetical protein